MIATVRAGMLAALVTFLSFPVFAASKPFHRDDLDDSAIKLEAQLKSDAGTIGKPVATLRREAEAALERRDFRAAMPVLSQIAVVTPKDTANWLKLARAALAVRDLTSSTLENERTTLIERAATAAYIGYQRT